jgi:hypothetical protein
VAQIREIAEKALTGQKLAVRGSNYDQFYIFNPEFAKKYSQRTNFGPKVSLKGKPFHVP